MPSRLKLAGLAAGTAALLSACMYDPGAYQQPYGQAYGGTYAPAPAPAQPDSGQYGYAPGDDGAVYAPAQDDAYLPYVADSDVVLIGGDTFIWFDGPDGHRYRRFYAHGDHRADVFQRRNQIRANGGWHGGGGGGGGGNPNNWHGGDRSWGNAPAARAPGQPMTQGNPYRPAPQNQAPAQSNFARPSNAPAPGARPGFNPGGNMGNPNGQQPRPRDEQHANPQVRPEQHGRWPDQQP